jgi:vacuolar-type H+-ATPase subunit I/STV1
MMLSPFLFFGIIIFTIRHWEKSTAYFKAAFLCWLITFFGVGFWMLAKYQGSSSSTAGIGVGLAFPYAMLPACAAGFLVWLCGFLIAKMTSSMSNYRKRKHGR